MASAKFGKAKGPIVVWVFFTLYYVVLSLRFWRGGSSGGTLPTNISLSLVLNLLLNIVISYGVPLIFLTVFVAFRERRRSLRDIFMSLGVKAQGSAKSVLWSVALFPLVAVVGLIGMMLGFFSASAVVIIVSGTQYPLWYLWYMVLYAFFPVAVVEEMFARGYLLDRLMPQHPSGLVKALPAILLSSVLFTSWHIPGYLGGSAFSVVGAAALLAGNVFPLSVILSIAYVRARTRNITGPILVHFLLDSLAVIIAIAQFT